MNELLLTRKLLRALWAALGLGLVAWIGLRNLPLDGTLKTSALPAEASPFIGVLRPDDRVKVRRGGETVYEVFREPAYFSLNVPRFFRKARLRFEFMNADQPIFEAGARTDLAAWSFDLQPVEALVLDRLGWSSRVDEGYRIYEKRQTVRSVAEILSEGDPRKTAVYHLDPVRWGLRIPTALDKGASLDCRTTDGCPKSYVYIAHPPFQAAVEAKGRVTVKLMKDGEVILTREAADETVDLIVTNAAPGLYRIEATPASEGAAVQAVRTRGAFAAPAGGPYPAGFDPEFPPVNAEVKPEASGFETIVARYQPPETVAGGWKTAEAVFDVGTMAKRGTEAQILVSVPGLKDGGSPVLIRRISATFEREPLSFGSLFTAVRKRLKL
jgi:hypothetical protein